MITIIVIGKKSDYDSFISNYEKRLKQPFVIKWVKIENSKKSGNEARIEESSKIQECIKKEDYVILLDERGKQLNNEGLVEKIIKTKNVTFIIGGSYGLCQKIYDRANFMWKLSDLILPYELVRLILTEQIYRSQCIFSSHPYHHK
ncbi:MAG: 23S rRNA (pseudouridine(1915)-N(3))-methyltransferase RlmH [Mycoplasmataceae bacterium]|jgi:23S rRNA (pseudouridine1915-N3)-methyltransferase|nr:23S rRNA (pseudouridine(1915)-N(3))-methyltransferase RlmH [Mycoplasmataceae bacterium]